MALAELPIRRKPCLDVLEKTTGRLLGYCRANNWAGWDPYDALNSSLFEAFRFLDSKWPRLVFTQMFKRSPVNLRALFHVPKTVNAKAVSLFLRSAIILEKPGISSEALSDELFGKLTELRSVGKSRWCWGYSFPWQTRTIVVPRGAPNLVCTTFVADALLDLYEAKRESAYLNMALSAAEYILEELYWEGSGAIAGFSYPLPSVKAQVHNANFLAAGLFCRVARHTGEEKFLAPALKVARYSASRQRSDGSWVYGELPTQNWIDNFHTGYNLSGLRSVCRYAGTNEFEGVIRKGFEFYRNHFVRNDGAAKYFHDRVYPIDIHAVAQSIITLTEFRDMDEANLGLANRVFQWAIKNMWDEERGCFYYRVLPFCTIKTSYMRWSQAWMLLALSIALREQMTNATTPEAFAAV